MTRIEVTEKHIKKGNPEDPFNCPVALAVRAVTKKPIVGVVEDRIILADDEYSDQTKFVVPKKVTRFIERFDDGKSVQPLSFSLREAK